MGSIAYLSLDRLKYAETADQIEICFTRQAVASAAFWFAHPHDVLYWWQMSFGMLLNSIKDQSLVLFQGGSFKTKPECQNTWMNTLNEHTDALCCALWMHSAAGLLPMQQEHSTSEPT